MDRLVRVNRGRNHPLLTVEISLHLESGGQVDSLCITETELVELAKALDLLCTDRWLIQVWRGTTKVK